MQTTFKTISETITAEYKDKGSRFIALAYPVTTVKEVKAIQYKLRKEHIKSVHVCYAYRIGYDGSEYRANDDGEPTGTAGLPILGQINSFELTDIAVMVVRYFGGTLLGVPGLIKAYKTVAREVLQATQPIEKKLYRKLFIKCVYADLNEVIKQLQYLGAEVVQRDLQLDCHLMVNIPEARYGDLLDYFDQHQTVTIGELK